MIDHHCHSVVVDDLGPEAFRSLLTESDRPLATDPFDSALGWAVRRWCPPALGLAAHAGAEEYLDRRRALGPVEATRRLLTAAGLGALLVDTGLTAAAGQPLVPLPELGALAGEVPVREIVRLESIAEAVAARAPSADGWATALTDALATALAPAVAVKSVLAYRHGLDIPGDRPSTAEVVRAASRWLSSPAAAPAAPLLPPPPLPFPPG
ncbi:hypothetical protein [Kitasatospora azatica]|uniref:hypothetical protein n=1 Tax=Kitasatospora azatica TaxID=58347 RepID=UPI000AFA9B28|nr:hypothetical protein [Kitasatospora azatica]